MIKNHLTISSFESVYYNYLPKVRLFELWILDTIARHYLIHKRESWVEGECDVIQSRQQNKRGYLSMQKRSARFMFYPSSCFCLRLPWKPSSGCVGYL